MYTPFYRSPEPLQPSIAHLSHRNAHLALLRAMRLLRDLMAQSQPYTPLIAPAVSPAIKWRAAKRNTTITGRIAIVAPSIWTPIS